MAKKLKKVEKEPEISTAIVLSSIEKDAKPLFSKLNKITSITAQADMDLAGENMKALKGIADIAYTKEQETNEPNKEAIKNIKLAMKKVTELFAPFHLKINAEETRIKNLIGEFLDAQDTAAAKLEADFESGKIKKVSTFAGKMASTQVVNGAAKRKKVKKLFITDPSKIPRQYLVPDEDAIWNAIEDGKKVAGAEIRKVNQVAI